MTETFAGKKLIVVVGSSGIGRQTAIQVANTGGSADIVGQDQERVPCERRRSAVVATPLHECFIPREQIDETLLTLDSFHPVGRVGTAHDLASAITFLLSERAG